PSPQDEYDQDFGEPVGDATIGYMEFDEEEGTQGYASGQSYDIFTRSQGKEVNDAARIQIEKIMSNMPPTIAKR
ncbi:hypothetical protein KI387_017874, partial [Taxus chinensis]